MPGSEREGERVTEQLDDSQVRFPRMKTSDKEAVRLFTAKNAAQSTKEGEVPITEALITKRNLNFPEDEDLSEKL